MMKFLYERDFSDPTKLNSYTIRGRKDEYGHIIPNTSLKEMMNSWRTFWKRNQCYNIMGDLLCVIVDKTPKCHPGTVGEVIEYNWAASTLYYRRL